MEFRVWDLGFRCPTPEVAPDSRASVFCVSCFRFPVTEWASNEGGWGWKLANRPTSFVPEGGFPANQPRVDGSTNDNLGMHRKADIRLPRKGDSNSRSARPIYYTHLDDQVKWDQ
jgi:hypothetical protein